MAELYRRVRGFSYRDLSALAVAVLLGAASGAAGSRASAQDAAAAATALGPSVSEIDAMASGLGSPDAALRRRSIAALTSLDASALPAIRERLGHYRRQRLHEDTAYRALCSFRHALGSRRADDRVDVLPGIPTALEADRSRVVTAMAERRLVAAALAEMGTDEGSATLVDLMAVDAGAWRWESKRIVWQLGERALPMLLVARDHDSAAMRSWARWGIGELGLREPGRAVQLDDPALLARVLRAYGVTRDIAAMPIVVSFVTHDRARVRAAARTATEAYGRNSIWQLRRAYRNLTGEEADASWGFARTAEALYGRYDEQRLAPVRTDLEAGLAALSAGDLDEVGRRFDDVLARAPDLPGRERMAPGYAALAAHAGGEGRAADAAALYRRAVRLAPDAPEASAWRAELAFGDAEARLSEGVLDAALYERTLALAPGHEGATERLAAAATVDDAGWPTPSKRTLALLAAALLLTAAGATFLRKRSPSPTSDEPPPDDETSPGLRAIDDTLH